MTGTAQYYNLGHVQSRLAHKAVGVHIHVIVQQWTQLSWGVSDCAAVNWAGIM